MADSNNITSNQTCVMIATSVSTFFILVYSILFLVGLLLNCFIMKFYFQQQASSSLMVYLKNLTAADFLLCLFLPLRIVHYASSSVPIQRLYSSFGASAIFLNMYASIIFMGYIAVNRYLKIVHPSRIHFLQTIQAARKISLITWLILLAPTVIYNILLLITQPLVSAGPGCCSVFFSELGSVLHKTLHAGCIIIFLLVFISLVVFYYSISHRVLQAQQRQLASSGCEKLLKSRRNMLVLVSIFCVCFVPHHLVRLPFTFLCSKGFVGQVLYYLKEVATLVSVFNICLDPVVYFFLCKAFRAQLSQKTESLRAQVNIQQPKKENENTEQQLSILQSTATSQTSEL
ncbi:P2Y purinoceptor 14-like [Oreochromis niloticus]|uniref:P2Y purinoceptor 14-like n=1 Tax=Oreochromis niloticus TaxID=8128 RepID=I3JIQ5_ORENI|nr:P2Y purinoceptor 14-like [Oreochromis niloticus]XP_025761902.1 P2Y purinoceptor 14-like [Oreochromis niloticus]XP_025761904.1 P2Y purinoceptor 14-like [Oreochromis niloticus]XP_025761905.1 P2Y purinoceptor 14-like [Oreochromis niloticus]